jgi:hypothetical protein
VAPATTTLHDLCTMIVSCPGNKRMGYSLHAGASKVQVNIGTNNYIYIYMYTCMCVCIYVTAPRYLRGPSSCTGRISSSCTGQGHSSCTRRTLFLAQEEDPLWHKKEYKHVYNGFVTVNLNWLCVQQWTFVISPGHFSSCLFLVKYRPMA